MVEAEGTVRKVRRFRSVSEKREIVDLVARAHGLNANQVFKWRRAFERDELVDSTAACTALLPVTLAASSEAETRELCRAATASGDGFHSH